MIHLIAVDFKPLYASVLGIVGVLASYFIDNSLLVLKYLALLLPIAYTIWKWKRDIDKNKKDKE